MVRSDGFEPPAYWFVASCSIQLSYERTKTKTLRLHRISRSTLLDNGVIVNLQNNFCVGDVQVCPGASCAGQYFLCMACAMCFLSFLFSA